jgi:excisionase family DNA binding protein
VKEAATRAEYFPPRQKTGQAAKYIGVSRRYLAQMTAQGRLPFIRLGPRCVLYERTDLDAFLAGARIDPATVTTGGR